MKLAFFYIEKYGALENFQICLSNNYDVRYDLVTKKIEIEQKDSEKSNMLNNFFSGNKDLEINCIVGENGSGKSSIIKTFYNAKFLKGVKFIIIYEKHGELIYKAENINSNFTQKIKTNIPLHKYNNDNYFYMIKDTFLDMKLLNNTANNNCYDDTTYNKYNKLMLPDVENSTNPFELVHNKKNIDLLIELFKNNELYDDIKNKVSFKKIYIMTGLKGDCDFYKKLIKIKKLSYFLSIDNTLENKLADFSYNFQILFIINFFEELIGILQTIDRSINLDEILKDSKIIFTEKFDFLNMFDNLYNIFNDINIEKNYILYFINNYKEIAKDNHFKEFIEVYIPVHSNYDDSNNMEFILSEEDTIKKFANIYYKHDRMISNLFIKYMTFEFISKENLSIHLSSGEKAKIELRKSLNDFIKIAKEKNVEDLIIFIDECDTKLHPRWQLEYIQNLVEHFKALKEFNQDFDFKLQFILTTNNPLIITDLPKEKVFKIKDGKVSNDKTETFAVDLYSLYKDEFFLDKNIGEFAFNKIKEAITLMKYLENVDSYEEQFNKLKEEYEKLGKEKFISQKIKYLEIFINEIGEKPIKYKLKQKLNIIKEDYDATKNTELKDIIKHIENSKIDDNTKENILKQLKGGE